MSIRWEFNDELNLVSAVKSGSRHPRQLNDDCHNVVFVLLAHYYLVVGSIMLADRADILGPHIETIGLRCRLL